ncbi:F0F1 ATP synthase subunit delta [Wenzhouxiangella sp. XN79A]|uniref:F0F1 ATP synthase subunit delta n=1 Tax=Wenzhouxiangella sp. XN79A TaxID=2724193 RepID=UPI00144AB5C4|nr:F0F1 ATP synthase subunit delta [Wenzhouxiangella sp. XN79A]NKI36218.1 F0F1 ATP synthase subunit delta [Wenzhouxiangella sp. XN79A]
MLAETTLARPYARAAFELADKAGTVDHWSRALGLAAKVAADPDAAALIGNPRMDAERLLALFGDVLGDNMDGPVRGFLDVLMHYRRLPLLPEIAAQYETLRRASEDRIKVRVTSAVEMDDAQRAKLADRLKQRFGSDIDMETEVDADLIGGLIVRAGDKVIDASVRGRLQQLGRQLVR